MPKFFSDKRDNNKIVLTGSDVRHIKDVLRKNVGDKINICELETSDNFMCEIVKIDSSEIICEIIEKLESNSESNLDITIFQGLPKAEKMELIIQKAVELGVNTVVPVKLKRCIVKLEGKDENKKVERWKKISEVAAKQCGRDYIPEISYPVFLKDIVSIIKDYDLVLVPYECENKNSFKNEIQEIKKIINKNLKIGIVIGPEGGFDSQEIQILKENGSKIITLGKRILRTETVAFTMASILMYELGDLN